METFDIAVIGAGPAGMTAALYSARAGLSVVMFEEMMPGGQLAQTDKIENYPGFPGGIGGFELSMAMKEQDDGFGVVYRNEAVSAVDFTGDVKTLTTANGQVSAKAVIIATGARSRKLGIEGEAELAGHGVSYCATCDGNFFRGQDVVVVGGGNTAAADAVYLSRICNTVHLVHRRGEMRATAADRHRVAQADNVVFHGNKVVDELQQQDGAVVGVVIRDVNTGETQTIPTRAVFVAIGKLPNTEAFVGQVPLTDAGYIRTEENGATEVAGVYAAGDVREKLLRQVATAISDGAIAAEAAAESCSA